jgi:hypothetical protein
MEHCFLFQTPDDINRNQAGTKNRLYGLGQKALPTGYKSLSDQAGRLRESSRDDLVLSLDASASAASASFSYSALTADAALDAGGQAGCLYLPLTLRTRSDKLFALLWEVCACPRALDAIPLGK